MIAPNSTIGVCDFCRGNRIAIARLRCPCGSVFRYCATCAQTAMRAAYDHTRGCDDGARAVEPAPRELVDAGLVAGAEALVLAGGSR